jgi:uncharacterized repeat protein (TIGR03803 family)
MKRQAVSFCLVVAFCLATTASLAQTFTTLASFHKTVGYTPSAALIQGADGNFYGGTPSGGSAGGYRGPCRPLGCGTVFKVSPSGQLTAVHKFDVTDGLGPNGPLALAADGNFYGTTGGGTFDCGTVFKITPEGTLITLYNFNCADGFGPNGLIQATDGNFYGTTTLGGVYGPLEGTVFKITPAGVEEVLHNFTGGADGQFPTAGLTQGTDGNFYGTTFSGGANQFCQGQGNQLVGCGTVFKITPKGKLTTLYNFCSQPDCADGVSPFAGLIQGADGNFYGTTSVWVGTSPGTLFRVTAEGVLTNLYTFCSQLNCADGESPNGLIQATDGNLYGTANGGGDDNDGTVFKMTLEGNLTTLHSFCSRRNCNDGSSPIAGLVQGTDGNLYGTASEGGPRLCPGTDNIVFCGTVFSLSLGLAPFVETIPSSGKLGAKVIILGNNLTGTTTVSFNGTPAKFKVVSDTEITTRVPKGTTTGPVTVTTPSGTLTSNVPFIAHLFRSTGAIRRLHSESRSW